MELHGWGRYPRVNAEVLEPINSEALQKILAGKESKQFCIPRGAGRSYGDSALAEKVVSSRFLDSFIAVDEANTLIRCGAGVTLDNILKVCIPKGWFLPVLPGTKFVTIGGAIAADIHGKNHHCDGSFCDYVQELTLASASGEVLRCSRSNNSNLFHATCGGMGLTGIIIDATVRLENVPSVLIDRQSLPASDLKQCFELIEEYNDKKYSVAWVDCLSTGKSLGRSVLHIGEHAEEGVSSYRNRRGLSIPFSTPSFLLNNFTMRMFNSALYNLHKKGGETYTANYDGYFFPLDYIRNWNRLYGLRGFLQYQFVLPGDSALGGLLEILKQVSRAGMGSSLAVLKKFGEGNKNLLSFPQEGYTLALDFKREKQLFPLLDELDAVIIDYGGRHYLAKDARMSEATFKAGYPEWEQFQKIKERVDPSNVFSSLQSRRIGLT